MKARLNAKYGKKKKAKKDEPKVKIERPADKKGNKNKKYKKEAKEAKPTIQVTAP